MQFSAFICLDPHISQVVIDDVVELTNTQKMLLFLVLLVILAPYFLLIKYSC